MTIKLSKCPCGSIMLDRTVLQVFYQVACRDCKRRSMMCDTSDEAALAWNTMVEEIRVGKAAIKLIPAGFKVRSFWLTPETETELPTIQSVCHHIADVSPSTLTKNGVLLRCQALLAKYPGDPPMGLLSDIAAVLAQAGEGADHAPATKGQII